METHTIQLTAQMRSIQEQNLEILDYVKAEMKKAIQLVAQKRSLQEQYLEVLDYVEEELEVAIELKAQRRNLPEQDLEILDYAKAQQEAIWTAALRLQGNRKLSEEIGKFIKEISKISQR